MNRHISNSFRNLCPVKCQYDGFLFVFQFGWIGMSFFSWMPRVTWKKILGMFYNILTCNAPKNSNFQFMFDPLQFALLRSKEKEVEEDGMQKIPLIFPLAPRSSCSSSRTSRSFLHLHSLWLIRISSISKVSYGLFSNCFDLFRQGSNVMGNHA